MKFYFYLQLTYKLVTCGLWIATRLPRLSGVYICVYTQAGSGNALCSSISHSAGVMVVP